MKQWVLLERVSVIIQPLPINYYDMPSQLLILDTLQSVIQSRTK